MMTGRADRDECRVAFASLQRFDRREAGPRRVQRSRPRTLDGGRVRIEIAATCTRQTFERVEVVTIVDEE